MIIDDTATSLFEIMTGGTALTALLAGTASVYHMQAPDNATLPYVVFSHQGGGPENITPQDLERNLWYVRAYSDTSAKTAADIFHQADGLLHKVNPALDYYHTISCVREENISLVENLPNNKKVWSVGGIYAIRTSTPTYSYSRVTLTDASELLLTG